MTSINQIIEVYSMNAAQYMAAARRVTSATGQMSAAVAGAKAGIGGISAVATGAAAGLGALAATAKLSFDAFRDFAEFDALRSGFRAIVGGGKEAEAQLLRLREIGRQPGIDFESAIRGSKALQEAGLSAAEAEATLREFANAGHLASSSTQEIESTLLQLRQALRKGKIDGDELRSVLENMPYAAQFLKQAFGTSVGAELAKQGVTAKQALRTIVEGLETIPRAVDGSKNALENMSASWRMAWISFGEGVSSFALPMVRQLTTELDALGEAGALATLGEKVTAIFDVDTSGLVGGLQQVIAGLMTVADMAGIARDGFVELSNAAERLLPFSIAMRHLRESIFGTGDNKKDAEGEGLFAKNMRTIELQMELAGKRRQSTPPSEAPTWEEPVVNAVETLTRAQERNTAALEATTRSIERMIFGGGALGRYGVSPVEMGSGRGRGSQVNIAVTADGPSIIREVMQLKRSGVL